MRWPGTADDGLGVEVCALSALCALWVEVCALSALSAIRVEVRTWQRGKGYMDFAEY